MDLTSNYVRQGVSIQLYCVGRRVWGNICSSKSPPVRDIVLSDPRVGSDMVYDCQGAF